jgi:hypothetical protein
VLEWNLDELAASLVLEAPEVQAYFTDGRRVSFLLERRLCREVLKGALAPSEGAAYDLVDGVGGRWEVRSISKGGIYFCPSYMVGSSRSFAKEGFEAKLDSIVGYILSDITLFPKIPYWVVPVSYVREWWEKGLLGAMTKVSRQGALSLLRDANR